LAFGGVFGGFFYIFVCVLDFVMVKLGAGEMNEVLKFFFHEIFEFVHIVGLFLLFLGEFLDD